MAEHKIRAHHGMCLAFFDGKGYSNGFTEHMAQMKNVLEKNPKVCIVNETDEICSLWGLPVGFTLWAEIRAKRTKRK